MISMIGEKKQTVQKSSAPKKIAKIQFGTLSSEDIKLCGEVRVSNEQIFQMPLRTAAPYGCLDSRLGISDKTSSCSTCHKRLQDCAGHFGYIQLELPVFHAGYFRHTLEILQCMCKECARLLLTTEERQGFLRRLQGSASHQIDDLIRSSVFKKIVEMCKKKSVCPHCGFGNGVVKRVPGAVFKIVHEIHRSKDGSDQVCRRLAQMRGILDEHPDYKPAVEKATELLTPLRAYELLKRIHPEDVPLLWMHREFGPPQSLVVWVVPVPPVPIRPSVPQDSGGGSTEDDLTVKLREIIVINNALRTWMDEGSSMKVIAQGWELLQIQVALFVNGDVPGIPKDIKQIRGLCQRLKGKQGRFRGNLSGKRVDFSARTVISPDPNLRVDQVGVPVLVAKTMTYPERVSQYNIDRMRKAVLNGPDIHPGANLVRSGFHVSALQYADRERAAMALRVGDIVERHMCDGDVVLFNRQPSLHKLSIMAHNVKVMPWRTFRFNECACTPYNADFDGDEMNMHLPQTEEAKAEASELMNIAHNLVSPRNGEPLVAATQDFLTGAYLLTQKDVFLSRAQFCRLVAHLSDAAEHIDMPLPVIWKPRKLWTGKQVMSILVRPNSTVNARVNVESEERFYTGKDTRHMCPQDGYVAFRQGELICGNLGKKTLGGDSKAGLFYVLIRDFGSAEATRCMGRLAKLTSRLLGDKGFSIGIDDVTPSNRMIAMKSAILSEGQRQADSQIEAYKTGSIRLKPGCDALQSLESEVNGILGKIRENCGKEALVTLNHRNAALRMAQCGSKGSALNISQMMACLGQQSVGGQRIQNGFVNRTLPHFAVGALDPAAKGFVANSFFSGLTATEFFFHTMGGREGLVDTAVKTAETGYMARRLMKALEDLSMQYDRTVRNSEQCVVQFSYGDDGLNPELMEKEDRPVDYSRLTVNICSTYPDVGADALSAVGIQQTVQSALQSTRFTSLLPQGRQFIDETAKFFNDFAERVKSLEIIERNAIAAAIAAVATGAAAAGAAAAGAVGTGTVATANTTTAAAVSPPVGAATTATEVRLKLRQLPAAERSNWVRLAVDASNAAEFHEAHLLLHDNAARLTALQLSSILEYALNKYHKSQTQPGEAIGAIGAQSLSEPGTQMTLKTFHFAGVASMNVTLGVPRLKEIINGTGTISTPIIEARLVQSDSMTSARIVKAQIEKTVLSEVVKYIKEIHRPEQSYIAIKLDTDTIQKLHLTGVNAFTVRDAILRGLFATSRSQNDMLKVSNSLKEKDVVVTSSRGDKLRVYPPDVKESTSRQAAVAAANIPKHQRIYFVLQALKAVLPHVIVQGIPSVSRAVINEESNSSSGGKGNSSGKQYYLLVEGYGLQEVMGCPGVDGTNTKSNHIIDMQKVLGIEAARSMITSEIQTIMSAYGITVDRRHLMLLSDAMTFKGEILGITRFGVAKMKESVLMLASFEKTTDHLFDAAVHSREDSIVGVSECIIMGVPIPIGTGLFKLLHVPKQPVIGRRRSRLLETLK